MKLIFPILFILISITAFIFGVNPLRKDVKTLKDDILIYTAALSNSTELQKKEDVLIKTYNEIKQSDKDRLDNFIPNAVNNIQFILEVERIANLHNMIIKDVKFESVKKNTTTTNSDPNIIVSEIGADTRPYGVFPIEFTTEADYDTFNLFLKDLEFNLRLIDVRSISFTVPDANAKPIEGANPNVYKFLLKVETYWLK